MAAELLLSPPQPARTEQATARAAVPNRAAYLSIDPPQRAAPTALHGLLSAMVGHALRRLRGVALQPSTERILASCEPAAHIPAVKSSLCRFRYNLMGLAMTRVESA